MSDASTSGDTAQAHAPDVAATALRDAARLLDMVADARDDYLDGMEEDSESAVAIENFGSGIRSAADVLRAEPHTVELLVPTWRYLGELAELDLRVRALSDGGGSGDAVQAPDVAERGRALVFIGDQFEGGRAVVCGEKVHPDRICAWALDDNGNCPEHGPRDLPGTDTTQGGAS